MIKKINATFLLIILNFFIFLLDLVLNNGYFKIIFGLNTLFFEGFFWQIVTTIFVHGSALHVIMNMAVLFQFGSFLEKYLGSIKFTIFYVLGGIFTSLLSLSYLFFNENVNLIGASGAICVLLGFVAYYDKQNAKGLIVATLLMSFAPLLLGVRVAWYAHIFGFIIGYLAGKLRNAYRFF